jgi:hypothetical protein
VLRRVLPPLLLLPVLACGGEASAPDAAVALDAEAPADAGRDAGEPADSGVEPDAGVPGDAGPPPDSGVRFFESSCAPCDTGCPGGLCLQAGGVSFCADRCDEDLDGCADGFTCFDISQGEGQYYCVPPGATCAPPQTGFGTSCFGDSTGCLLDMDHCQGDLHALGYCTRRCDTDSGCPAGYACALGDDGVDVCVATQVAASERCGRDGDPAAPGCAVDSDCAALPGAVCVRSEPRLPGVCALSCAASGCAEGFTCAETLRGPACLSAPCACHGQPVAAGTRDLLQEVLTSVDSTRCGAIFDLFDWAPNPGDIVFDPYRLSWYDAAHNAPLEGLETMKGMVRGLDEDAAGPAPHPARAAEMVARMAALLDRPGIRVPAGPVDAAQPLAEAVAQLIEAAGGAPDRATLRADAAAVPMDLQRAVAQAVDGVRRAHLAGIRAVPGNRVRDDLYNFGPAFIAPRADGRAFNAAADNVKSLLNDAIGYGDLFGGGADLLDALAQADLSRFAQVPTSSVATSTATFVFVAQTPIGRVAIGDGESGIYDPRAPGMSGAWALLVDLGGNDEYRVPAGGNQSAANSVSVLVDLGGDDVYGYVVTPAAGDAGRLPSDGGGRYAPQAAPDQDNGPISLSQIPRQGAGRMGVGVLYDVGAGRDHYQSLRLSQGTGVFGVGVLLDEGGDDQYFAEAASQGASAFGIGLLYDAGGDDVRRAYTMSQGFAFARGAGAIYDLAGDDQYLMDPGDPAVGGDPLYFNAQRPGRANTTLGQGFAFGRRADTTDRAFMSGGLGLLVDAAGRDRYEGSVFAQGGGYWFGTGVLADHGGDDTYDGLWYAMAAGAHYALGALLDADGDDVYGGALPRVNVTVGGGHDYTAVFLVDEAGNDTYHGARITVGAGNLNGIGVFVDNGGDDAYDVKSAYGVGAAGLLEAFEPGSPRKKVQTIGLFIDAGGRDEYTVDGAPFEGRGDDQAWVAGQNADPMVNTVEWGAGVDGVGESTLHAR